MIRTYIVPRVELHHEQLIHLEGEGNKSQKLKCTCLPAGRKSKRDYTE